RRVEDAASLGEGELRRVLPHDGLSRAGGRADDDAPSPPQMLDRLELELIQGKGERRWRARPIRARAPRLIRLHHTHVCDSSSRLQCTTNVASCHPPVAGWP